MSYRFTLPYARVFDAAGDALPGAKLAFFASGTTTPLTTYSDAALTIANPNPVIADANGQFGAIFLTQAACKAILSDADDALIWSADPIQNPPTMSEIDDAIAAAIAAIPQTSFSTGDAKLTLKAIPDEGWVMADDGTIGNASSGASNRAHADTSALFALIWNNLSNTAAPVTDSSGNPVARGASASADFAAARRIKLGAMVGRALAVAGVISDEAISDRALGDTTGAETHALSVDEMPSHYHGYNDRTGSQNVSPGSGFSALSATLLSANTSTVGGNAAHNNMQPTCFLNVMLKL